MDEQLVFDFEKKFNQMVKDLEVGIVTTEELKDFVHEFLEKIKEKNESDRLQALADAELAEYLDND